MSDAALDLGGAPAPSPAPAPGPAPSPAPSPAPAPAPGPWDGLDDDGKKFVETKGFKSPADALTALREYQPPESADKYQLPVPDGADPAFAKTAAVWFHKHGVTAKAAEGFVAEYNAYATAEMARMAQEDAQVQRDAEAKSQRENQELTREWGEANDAKRELAKRAYTTYVPGATPEEKARLVQVLQREVGYKATMQMFANMGAHLAEDRAHGLGGQGSATPQAVASKLYDKSNMNP